MCFLQVPLTICTMQASKTFFVRKPVAQVSAKGRRLVLKAGTGGAPQGRTPIKAGDRKMGLWPLRPLAQSPEMMLGCTSKFC